MLLTIVILYFIALIVISHFTSKNIGNSSFFSGDRKSPWYLVAFGMIGATVSGISLVSVPGMVESNQWYYLQMCIGFFFGYLIVAYVLLPLYYKVGLTSIYEYLNLRFNKSASKTGSSLFVVAKMVSSATKLYIVILILQQFIFEQYDIPFWLTTSISISLIWLYTHRGGIKTIVWTDTLQTLFMLASIIIIIVEGIAMRNSIDISNISNSAIFNFSNWGTPSHFVKQFFSGIFVVIVMTGLDQDMMQKNLSIKSLRKSQLNMITYGAAFIPVNLLLLFIGSIMITYYGGDLNSLPTHGDKLLPYFVENELSYIAVIVFVLGIIAASFSSADSALTSITTTLSIDIFKNKSTKLRKIIHLIVCIVFTLLVILFEAIPSKSILDTIYTIVGYCYGPLLGIFALGLFTKINVHKWAIPIVSVLSPLICYVISTICLQQFEYRFGYELLMLNGLITFGALLISRKK